MSNWIDDTINAIEKIVGGAVENGKPYPAREVEKAIARNYQSSHEISSQADDMAGLVKDIQLHQRRKRMEVEFGPIKTTCHWPPIPFRNFDYEAYFDRYCDVDMPNWARGFGATEAKALEDLLDNAEEHFSELLDAKYQANLERRAGCND